MSDGLNDARAIRITEIMADYRNLLAWVSQLRAEPTAEEYYLEGYKLHRQCLEDARVILTSPFNSPSTSPTADVEVQKTHLRNIIIDASVRRFRCQRLYQKAYASYRWASSRKAVLQGQRAHAGHAPGLQAADNTLQVELASITDEVVYNTLRSQDISQGRWVNEDPSLATIQAIDRARR